MNSLALLLVVILFLGPGLGVYAGFFVLGGSSQFKAAPPRPNSLVTVSVVILGSILSHAIASNFSSLLDTTGQPAQRINLDHSPNPYQLVVELARSTDAITGPSISYLLGWSAILPIASTSIAWVGSLLLLRMRPVAAFVYGWADQIVRQAAPDQNWVVGFVLTRMSVDEHFIGYEGTIKELTIDPEKQVKSITLVDVERFLVSRQSGSFRRKQPQIESPKIANIHIPGDRIENIAFTIFTIEDT